MILRAFFKFFKIFMPVYVSASVLTPNNRLSELYRPILFSGL